MYKIKIINADNVDLLRIAQETVELYGYDIKIGHGKIFEVKEKDAQSLCMAIIECGVDAEIIN